MQVNAIGFGTDLDDNAMKTLAMLDNTGLPFPVLKGIRQRTASYIIAEELIRLQVPD